MRFYDLRRARCSPEILSDEILLKQFHGNVEGKAARDEKVNAHPVIKVTDLEYVSRSPHLVFSPSSLAGGYVYDTTTCVYIHMRVCVCTDDRPHRQYDGYMFACKSFRRRSSRVKI